MTRSSLQGKIQANASVLARIVTGDANASVSKTEAIYDGIPFDKLPDTVPTVAMCQVELVKLLLQQNPNKCLTDPANPLCGQANNSVVIINRGTGVEYKRDVYFNKPDVLYYDEPDEVKLEVEPKPLNDSDIDLVFHGLSGAVTHKSVKVGAFLTANLSAPKSLIEISARDDRIQKVTRGASMSFVWYVKPIEIGKIPIRLDLFSQENASKDAPINPIQVLQEDWVVDARGIRWLKYQIADLQPIGVALCAVGAATVSALGFFGFKSLGRKAKSDSEV